MERRNDKPADGKIVSPQSEFGTIPEVCRKLHMSRTALYGVMDRLELPYCKFGRSRRIRWSEVEKFIERHTVSAK